MRQILLASAVMLTLFPPLAPAQVPAPAAPVPDITGRWQATFDTQVGSQEYTYDFVVKDGTLTGTIVSSLGSRSDVRDGTVEGTAVSFKETLTFMDMSIDVTYAGQIVSADEIKFTREVGDIATEELVARRVRQPSAP